MRQQVVLHIHGYPVKVELCYGSKTARTYHYCFGMITAKVKEGYPLKKLEESLNRVFSEETIKKMVPDPFVEGNYAYILGEVERVYPKIEKEASLDHLYISRGGKKVFARRFLLEVITERVRFFERQMNLPLHEVKIKKLSAVLGNNNYRKRILCFNERLIHFSIDLIDEVVIHELCHDFHQNHSALFYNKVRAFCPDYKMRKEKLIYGVRR